MAHINETQLGRVAQVIARLPDKGNGMDFYSFGGVYADDKFPKLHHPDAHEFFFFVCMHDFGFWYGDDAGYVSPLYGTINGKENIKGSDLLWKAAKRAFDQDNRVFAPICLADITPEDFHAILSDDNGPIPFPDLETRLAMTRAYGKWFIQTGLYPTRFTARANISSAPLATFLGNVKHIPGYDRDPLEKRNLLLAMALANRPERFLKVTDPEHWRPIIDYHLMRLALRLGIVELEEPELRTNIKKEWVTDYEERGIRSLTHAAISDIISLSERTMPFVDEKMWNARRYCPETDKPDCPKCIFNGVCKKRIELFQPIMRTTAY